MLNKLLDQLIQFCKGKAKADRWQEEVELVTEETRRTERFFKFRSDEWMSLSQTCSGDPAEAEGRRAFAREQVAQFERMRVHCISK